MRVQRLGSEIRVVLNASAVRATQDGIEVTLSKSDAEQLLSSLASLLPYRVLKLAREVVVEDVKSGEVVVRFVEGRKVKTAKVPFDILRAHIEALKRIGVGNATGKREYAKMVVEEMARSANASVASIARSNLPFSWETFFGRRHDYYVLYYVPLLLLRKAGYVGVKHLTVEALDVPVSIRQLVERVREEV